MISRKVMTSGSTSGQGSFDGPRKISSNGPGYLTVRQGAVYDEEESGGESMAPGGHSDDYEEEGSGHSW